MTQAASRIGAQLGVGLHGGTPVKASGNCLIESIKGNIEERDVFDVKLNETALELRLKSVEEGEKVIGESPYRIDDYNETDWAKGWDSLKNEGIWDVEYFGDLMIIAISHYIHKNILLINTNPQCPKVTVIMGDQFGEPLDTDAPVILAYSGDHYESLIPNTEEDEEKLKELIKKYVDGKDICADETESKEDGTGRELPKFQIDNWNNNYDSKESKGLSDSFQKLILGTTENATRPVYCQAPLKETNVALEDDTGIDNWKHCHPKFTNQKSCSNWEDEIQLTSKLPYSIRPLLRSQVSNTSETAQSHPLRSSIDNWKHCQAMDAPKNDAKSRSSSLSDGERMSPFRTRESKYLKDYSSKGQSSPSIERASPSIDRASPSVNRARVSPFIESESPSKEIVTPTRSLTTNYNWPSRNNPEMRSLDTRISGIDNWKHYHPGRRGYTSRANSLWEEKRTSESTPIPIVRVKTNPGMITIPITIEPVKPCKQEVINGWGETVETNGR